MTAAAQPVPMRGVETWGPFAADRPPLERWAQLMALRALVRLLCGMRGEACDRALHAAQVDPDDSALVDEAAAALGRLEPGDYRRVLASYAGLIGPGYRPPASRAAGNGST